MELDIDGLLAAAREEGGEQKFGELLQTTLQGAVDSAVGKVNQRSEELGASVQALEGKRDELLGELKGYREFLDERELGRGAEGIATLKARLESGSEVDPAEVSRQAKQMAITLTAEAVKEHQESIDELTEKLAKQEGQTQKAWESRDRQALALLVNEAQAGKGKPQLIPALRDYYLDHVGKFVKFEDRDGKRLPVVVNGDVPILGPTGKQATVTELFDMTSQGGDRPWNTDTRDFFRSNATGGDAGPFSEKSNGAVSPTQLGKTASLADYEAARGKVAGS